MIKIVPIKDIPNFCLALEIRIEVFVLEQGVPIELELDENDTVAQHYLAFMDGTPVAVSRLLITNDIAKIGRCAVRKDFRKKGIGSLLCKKMMNDAISVNCSKIVLDAQLQAEAFYKKIGYTPYGEPFDDVGIPHIKMLMQM